MTQATDAVPATSPTDLRPLPPNEATPGGGGASPEASTSRSPAKADRPGPAAAPNIPASATRLLVEQGKGGEGFVYKLVDRATGAVLSEFPREAAQSLAKQPGYTAGAIVDESA